MNICDLIESSFRRIDNKIDTLFSSISSESDHLNNASSTRSAQERLNQYRSELLSTLEKSFKQVLARLDQNYKNLKEKTNKSFSKNKTSVREALTNQCTLVDFKLGELNLRDVDFQRLIHENDFDVMAKLKYASLLRRDSLLDLVRLNEIYSNRSTVFVYPLSKNYLFVHYKSTNLIQVLVRKYGGDTKLTPMRSLNLDENYYCKFYIYNKKIIANLLDCKQSKSVLNVYDLNLNLLNTNAFAYQINVVCINESEIVYWSYNNGFVVIDMANLSQVNETIKLNTNDKLLHVSSSRLFYLGYGLESNPVINIYARKTHEFINFILFNSNLNCCFGSLSRVYVKTNDASRRICVYDENGSELLISSSQLFEPFTQFEFIDASTLSLVDFQQNNINLL